jgi:hypothetical protein
MACRSIPADKEGETLDTCTATLEVWVTFIKSVGASNSTTGVVGTRELMMSSTGFEEGKDGENSPDSSWETVSAPTLETFWRDVASIKTPGRFKIRYPVETVDENEDVEETIEFEAIEPLDVETDGTAATTAELIPVLGEMVARNWGGLRRNIILLGRTVNQSKKSIDADFETVETEFRSLSRKLALLDTRIGTNLMVTGVVSVWEAIEDVLAEGKQLESRMSAMTDRQTHLEDLHKSSGENQDLARGELDALYLSFENFADSYE